LVSREVRDLGDAILLHDPTDREPFWNRIAGIAWPAASSAFDRRLTEALALFAGLDRIPHVWPMPGFDEPGDLTARLLAHGFEDFGGGLLMALDPARALPPPVHDGGGGVQVERLHRLSGGRSRTCDRGVPSHVVHRRAGAAGRDRARGGARARERCLSRDPRPGRRGASRGRSADDLRGSLVPLVDRDGPCVPWPRARPSR